MTEIKRYTKKPITIEAVQLNSYGDCTRVVAWINENGGSAVFSPALKPDDQDYVIVQTIEGNMEAYPQWWIIKGVKGEFYPCDPEVFELSYTPEPDAITNSGVRESGLFTPDSVPNPGQLKAAATP